MIQPVDVGIWNFWRSDSSDETTAVYTCRKCISVIRSAPEELPDICPYCGFAESPDFIDDFRGKYFFLSNFYEKAPFVMDGIRYLNSEAAFQAYKCKDANDRQQFANLNPSDAKKLGRHVKLRDDWEDIKVDVMYRVLYEKFSQNKSCMDRLLATGDAILIEGNDWGDDFWGQVNHRGKNYLGRCLMGVRSKLQSEREGE